MGYWVSSAGGSATIAAIPRSSLPATTHTRIYAQIPHSASNAAPDTPPPRPPRRINGSPPRRRRSVAEVQRAIGVADDTLRRPGGNPSTSSSSSSYSFMDLLSNTPIGQAEGPVERKLRESAEWVAEGSEAHAGSVQKTLLVVCLKILPVWLLLLIVASGVVKLPFNLPFMDDIFT